MKELDYSFKKHTEVHFVQGENGNKEINVVKSYGVILDLRNGAYNPAKLINGNGIVIMRGEYSYQPEDPEETAFVHEAIKGEIDKILASEQVEETINMEEITIPKIVYDMLTKKAEKWDKLDAELGKIYDEDPEGEGGDLLDIGEAAASAFGYL